MGAARSRAGGRVENVRLHYVRSAYIRPKPVRPVVMATRNRSRVCSAVGYAGMFSVDVQVEEVGRSSTSWRGRDRDKQRGSAVLVTRSHQTNEWTKDGGTHRVMADSQHERRRGASDAR